VGASVEAVRAEFQRLPARKVYTPREESPAMPPPEAVEISPPTQQEQWLLRLVFHEPAHGDWAADCLDPRWVDHVQVRQILERSAESGATAEVLLGEMDAGTGRLFTAALASGGDVPDPGRQLWDLVTRLRNRFLDRRLGELTRITAQPNLPEAQLLEVLEEQRELRQEKNEELPQVPSSAAA